MRVKKIILSALALIALASCKKEEGFEQNPSDTSAGVQFTANMATTRVTDDVDNPKFDALDEIGIFAGATLNSKYRIKELNKPDMEYVGNGDDKIFPPENGTSVNYYAYHPYNANATLTKLSVDLTTKNEPMIWAKTENQSGASVDLQFSHQLVMLRLKFVAGGVDITTLDGATATLVGANAKGEFNLQTGAWDDTKYEKADLTIGVPTDGKQKIVYVMPLENQTELRDVSIVIKAGGRTFIWKVPTPITALWDKGKYYDYTINVGN